MKKQFLFTTMAAVLLISGCAKESDRIKDSQVADNKVTIAALEPSMSPDVNFGEEDIDTTEDKDSTEEKENTTENGSDDGAGKDNTETEDNSTKSEQGQTENGEAADENEVGLSEKEAADDENQGDETGKESSVQITEVKATEIKDDKTIDAYWSKLKSYCTGDFKFLKYNSAEKGEVSVDVPTTKYDEYNVFRKNGKEFEKIACSKENGKVIFAVEPGEEYIVIRNILGGFRHENGIWYMDVTGYFFEDSFAPSGLSADERYEYFSEMNSIMNDGGYRFYYGANEEEVSRQSIILRKVSYNPLPAYKGNTSFYGGLVITCYFTGMGIWDGGPEHPCEFLGTPVDWNYYKKGSAPGIDAFYLLKEE